MKYRVLKEFLYDKSLKYEKGNILVIDDNDYRKGSTDFLLLNGFIEEIKDEPWKPKEGDTVHYLVTTGDVAETVWTGGNNIDDYGLGRAYSLGLVRQSEQEVVQFKKWLKAFKVLRDDTKGFKPNWKDQSRKYWVYWGDTAQTLEVNSDVDWVYCLIYFATEADAEESIKNHEKEWLTFLGVKK